MNASTAPRTAATRTIAIILLGIIASAQVSAGEQKPSSCVSGVYSADGPALIGTMPSTENLIVIAGSMVSIGSRCPSVQAAMKPVGAGIALRAEWPSCAGLKGGVILEGTVDASCTAIHDATLRAGKLFRRFSATAARKLPTIVIDAEIRPRTNSLPRLDEAPRPIASIEDGHGSHADFVANEVILASTDPTAVASFVKRTGGQLLASANPGGPTVAGIHLIRVDASRMDASELVSDLRSVNPYASAASKVSSRQALQLLAFAAREKAAGKPVNLNWIAQGTDYANGQTTEATVVIVDGSLIPQTPYSFNTANLSYMNSTSTQMIGVTSAWRTLRRLGRLGTNTVPLAIVDGGFALSQDFPAGLAPLWGGAGTGDPTQQNALACAAGPCPWHGTASASAAMALPDNHFGSAGPAGPVAEPILVYISGDLFDQLTALGTATQAGAKIVNMSFGTSIPVDFEFFADIFDNVTYLLRQSGILFFAGAGNEGKDLDACEFSLNGLSCFSKYRQVPCLNRGVICVGGLARDSQQRASWSNYGTLLNAGGVARVASVDIYSPGTIFTSPDPQHAPALDPNNYAQENSGTSVAAPFAAGIAALIWSADPGLSADQVETILLETASGRPLQPKYVNAYMGVIRALGNTNAPPSVAIASPAAGMTIDQPGLIAFEATAVDAEDGPLSVTWTESPDGKQFVTLSGNMQVRGSSDYSPNQQHTFTASVTDLMGATTTVSRQIFIRNPTPYVTIIEPAAGAQFDVGAPIRLLATAFDPNEPGERIADGNFSWESNVDGFLGTGRDITVTLSQNSHQVGVIARDRWNDVGSADIAINVMDLPGTSPSVSIWDPPLDRTYNAVGLVPQSNLGFIDVKFWGDASDADGALQTVQWRVKVGGVASVHAPNWEMRERIPGTVSQFPTLDVRLLTAGPCNQGSLFAQEYAVTLEATDLDGITSLATRRVTVQCQTIN